MGKRKTHETFVKEIYNLVGNEYTVLGRYASSKTKLNVIHNTCGHIYDVRPDKILDNRRCPKCARNQIMTTNQFKANVLKDVGNEYEVLGEYTRSRFKIKMKHQECNREFDISPNDWQQGGRCSHCFTKFKKTTEEFKREVDSLVGSEYEVLEEYINANKNLTLRHVKCNRLWSVSPSTFLQGTRCPRCTVSKGEDSILKWLTENKANYVQQYTTDDCRNIYTLPFDFAILDNNKSIKYLIEYDGQQHFKPVQFGGISLEKAKDNLKQTQYRDSIKTKYCKENNIPLLRIDYKDFKNIDDILNTNLL